jgi:uncharacterized repeat protein (TIGR01451 family)
VFSLRASAHAGSIAVLCALVTAPAHAVGVAAGTNIDSTASVSYSVGAVDANATSTTVSVTVAEILDVVVTAPATALPVGPGSTAQVLRFRVTNTGNGPEAFSLVLDNAIAGDNFDPTGATPSIYLDTDGSGTLTPADTIYNGSNDPTLAADAFLHVFVVNDIPAGVVDGNIGRSSLIAEAATGSGDPGTPYSGMGVGNTFAVVGTTRGRAIGVGEYLVAGVTVTAAKSQAVLDPFNTTHAVPGARITYTIVVSATGTGSALNTVFGDDIPDNTTYVPGSLRLNSVALTDGADADAGTYETTPTPRVRVALGTLTQSGGSQTVEFAVTIN